MNIEYISKSKRLNMILLELEKNMIIDKEYLANKLGVCTRTIARDVDILINMGHPIQRIKGRGGGYGLNKKD